MDRTKRKKIGLIFDSNRSWIGGAIYIMNIIKALQVLDDTLKPIIKLYYNRQNADYLLEIKEIGYEYIEFEEYDLKAPKWLIYLFSWITLTNRFLTKRIKAANLDGLFPFNDFPISTRLPQGKIVSWIPDFQHKFYPQYFSKWNLILREIRFRWVLKRTEVLILSSKDTFSNYLRFYPEYSKDLVKIVPFVSATHNFTLTDAKNITAKFGIKKPYFIVCNQFYEHKNHMLIFKAINLVKEIFPDLLIVFTGEMRDYKNPRYFKELQEYIQVSNIQGNCLFLGVIKREDQLSLMKTSIAVIQPSKFEGWSTVIEDAKSLNVPVLASNLDVHKEQLGDNSLYFDIENEKILADQLSSVLNAQLVPKPRALDYNYRLKVFARQFLSSFE